MILRIEEMVRSQAVLASPQGGMLEMKMLAGTDNIVADPASTAFVNAAIRLLGDGKSRRAAGTSGHEKALQVYNPAVVAREYVDTIKGWL